MSAADSLINAATGAGAGGIVIAVINAVFSYRSKRAEAAQTESDTWRQESLEVFGQLRQQYDECQTDLKTSKKSHDEQITKLRREHNAEIKELRSEHNASVRKLRAELGEVKDGFSRSLDVIDELLGNAQGVPAERIREIHAANRAHRAALWGYPPT